MNSGLFGMPGGPSAFAAGNLTLTSSGTFTPVVGANYYLIDLVAGGASGGTGTSAGNGGGAGGGGQRIYKIFPASLITSLVTVTIGAGGTGVINTNGNNGGNTTFGTLLTALGGTSVPNNTGSGGTGGGSPYPGAGVPGVSSGSASGFGGGAS